MNLQTQAVSAALALYPVYLPQWVTPVLPPGTADGGIPQVAFKPLGVEMVIEPLTGLLNWAMAAYDVVTIYVNGVSTNVAKTIYPGEENNRFLLLVPASWFVNGFNEIFYKVKRVSGNFDDSQKLNVLYHDPAPGEPAPAGITIVFPPNIVANGVGPAEAAAGVLVTFTISFARTFDEILLVVGTWSTTITVTDPAKPITLTLTAADFQQIGDNANTPVKCTVTDQLGNGNQSATTYLDIHANRLDLPAPTVKGQTGNNFNPTLQDVRMMVPSGSLRLTDKVTAIWQGATGTPVAASFTSPQRLVSAGLEFIVPRSVVAYSLGKPVIVTYDIERNGITSTSLPLSLNILPLPTTALIPPKIIEADANNVLDVIALGTSNATLHGLLWTLIEVGQQVWLTLEGKKADGSVHNLPIWNGGGHYANQTWVSQGFWPKPVANSYLKLLGHGSRLTIKFKASLDKSNVEATAVVFPDRTYTIRALALTAPVITSVKDLSGWEIPDKDYTVHDKVTITGSAPAGQEVEVFDGTTSKGKVRAGADSTWSIPLSGLTLDVIHHIKAVARYGTNPSSNVRSFTSVFGQVPKITSVKDLSLWEIPSGGYTVHNSVTLSGTANAHLEVEIFDDTTSKGKAKADAQGRWSCPLTGLAHALHTFKAKALYGSSTVSNQWSLTVVHGQVPAITAVTDSKGATIANGGSTSDTTVQLTGTANAFLEVEIFEGSASKGKVKANDKGIWTLRLTGLAVGGHRFIAKALYGSGTQSGVWALTVRTFLSELTDFNNKSYGGWQKGPAGAELQFIANANGYHLFNNTSQYVNHSGMVLQKMFTAEIGRQYKIEVSTRVVNYSSGNYAMLVLHVGGDQSPGFTIDNGEWRTISFVAAATNTQLLLKITNIQTQRHGNDYDIDNILVRTVDN